MLLQVLITVSVVVDPIRQAGQAVEHTGKEYPGWIQADHHDEPCEPLFSPLSVLNILCSDDKVA